MKLLVPRLLFLIPLLLLEGCVFAPPVYLAQSIRSQVVDEYTGKPLDKVIVVAIWEVIQVGFGDGGSGRRLRIVETVTDKDGYFVIPSSLMLRPPLTYLDRFDPIIYLFKPGYLPVGRANEEKRNNPVRFSEWDGKRIKLGRLGPDEFTLEEEAYVFESFFGSIEDIGNHEDWKNYPRMLLAMTKELQRLEAKGTKPGQGPMVPNINYFSPADRQFLEAFKHEF